MSSESEKERSRRTPAEDVGAVASPPPSDWAAEGEVGGVGVAGL